MILNSDLGVTSQEAVMA